MHIPTLCLYFLLVIPAFATPIQASADEILAREIDLSKIDEKPSTNPPNGGGSPAKSKTEAKPTYVPKSFSSIQHDPDVILVVTLGRD
jgi:hypothetical protein